MEWDLFWAKQFFEQLLHPLQSWLLVSFVGIIVCVWKPRHFLGPVVLLSATAWLAIGSLPLTATWLLGALEAEAGHRPDPGELQRQGITCVVVLGNIHEGVALWKTIHGTKLVIASGSLTPSLADKARQSGVAEGAIVLESEGRDTEEQARKLTPIVGNEPFVVSTWALHMQRTLLSFRQAGLHPVPAPTDFVAPSLSSLPRLRPSLAAMSGTKLALHEYLGMIWLLVKSALTRT